MYDLKKLEEKFHEFLKEGINEKEFNINGIKITEELLEQRESFLIHFGYISYFLVIEDEKPVVYANVSTRMDTDLICFIVEEGYECYDVFEGDHEDISEKYYSKSKNIKNLAPPPMTFFPLTISLSWS